MVLHDDFITCNPGNCTTLVILSRVEIDETIDILIETECVSESSLYCWSGGRGLDIIASTHR